MENLPIKIDSIPAVEVFKPAKMDAILKEVQEHVDSFVPDLTTAKGRGEIKSLAYKVAQSKTTLDNLGKDLVADKKKEIGLVDAERKKARDFLDALKTKVRQPLTDWEEAEEKRVGHIMENIEIIKSFGDIEGFTADQIKIRLDGLNVIAVTEDRYMECLDQAEFAKASTLRKLEEAHAAQVKYEQDQAELEALRKEKAERDAAEAAAREEAERKAEEERLRKEGEARAKKEAAEREAKLKEQKARALREKREAKEREKEAKAQAKIAAEQARQEERARQERELEEAKAAEAQRKAQEDHRNKIHREACRFIKGIYGTTEEQALGIISAISNGEVPHISITY